MPLPSFSVTCSLCPFTHLSIHLLMFVQSSFSLLKEMEIACSDPAVTEVTNWYPLGQHLQFFDSKVGTPYHLGTLGLMCFKESDWPQSDWRWDTFRNLIPLHGAWLVDIPKSFLQLNTQEQLCFKFHIYTGCATTHIHFLNICVVDLCCLNIIKDVHISLQCLKLRALTIVANPKKSPVGLNICWLSGNYRF